MARVRLPLTLTSTSGAPAGRSRCMMQPASQVRAGPGGASVGMGSSRGEGGPGLLNGRWVPSGARRSWTTLRGNAALAPRHPLLGLHPPALLPRRVQRWWLGSSSRPPVGENGGVLGGSGLPPPARPPGRPRGTPPAANAARVG